MKMKMRVIIKVINMGFTALYIVYIMISRRSFFLKSFNKCMVLMHFSELGKPSYRGYTLKMSTTDIMRRIRSTMFQSLNRKGFYVGIEVFIKPSERIFMATSIMKRMVEIMSNFFTNYVLADSGSFIGLIRSRKIKLEKMMIDTM